MSSCRSLSELRNPKCQECILHKTAEFVCLTGYGNVKAEIVFVGEAPGQREDDSGKPFVGRAGKLLDIILEEIGLDRDSVYITNVVHCRPPDNRTPVMDEIRACRKYLLDELKAIKPKIVVCLGNIALKGMMDNHLASVSKERGKILEVENYKVIPTYHPAAALRNNYYAQLILEDLSVGLKRARELISGNMGSKVTREYYLVDSNTSLLKARKELMDSPFLVTDAETTGLDSFDPKQELKYIGITNQAGKGWVFKYKEYMQETISEILNSASEQVINHNIKFDIKWYLRYGIKVKRPIFDTQVAMHLLDENYPDKSLEHLTLKELPPEMGRYLSNWKKKFLEADYGKKFTDDEWRQYNGGDLDATFQLFEIYRKRLKEEELENLMALEMKNLKVLSYMEFEGVKIDQQALKQLKDSYLLRIYKAERTLKRSFGDINFNSSQQLAKVLYQDLGLPIIEVSSGGAPSCSESAIEALLAQRNLAKPTRDGLSNLLEYRNLAKLYNTYLEGLTKKELLKADGKVHCNYKITGTVTGRLSCTDPNLQNIPREGDIKKMFVSSFKDGLIIQGDYSQAELRILAHMSRCSSLIKAFESGRDIHTEVATKVFRKPYDQITEQERKFTKQVNFGIVYLISARGLSVKIESSESRARKLIDDWFEEFPEVKDWIRKTKREVIEQGFTSNIFGRKRRFTVIDPDSVEGREAQRQGVNSPIQGGAGDLTKWVGTRTHYALRAAKLKTKVVINVHDSVMLDAPKEEVKQSISILRGLAIDPPIKLRVPLVFDIKVGKSWGELEKVK